VKVDADGSHQLDFHEFARSFGDLSEAQTLGFYSNMELLRRLFDELRQNQHNLKERDCRQDAEACSEMMF
jgi:hypothetical protein